MSRNELIQMYSIVPIGGCEDATRERVKRLFKKSNDINYKNFDTDKISNLDQDYSENKERYNILVNLQFDRVLSDREQLELHILENSIGFYAPTFYIPKIIILSKITIDIISDFKLFNILPIQGITKLFKVSVIASYSLLMIYFSHIIHSILLVFYPIFWVFWWISNRIFWDFLLSKGLLLILLSSAKPLKLNKKDF